MVIYTYDPNAILVETLRDITKESILQEYQKIIGHLNKRGFKPRLQRLENEAPQLLQNEMDSKKSMGKQCGEENIEEMWWKDKSADSKTTLFPSWQELIQTLPSIFGENNPAGMHHH